MRSAHLPGERLVERADGGVDLGVHLEVRHGAARRARRADGGGRDLAAHRLQRRRRLLRDTTLRPLLVQSAAGHGELFVVINVVQRNQEHLELRSKEIDR